MNLQIAGHHIEVTPALRLYVENMLDPVFRHFDMVTGVNVVLSVEKLKHTAEVTVHV
ncbi:MAG: ribosome-associated translation inhibitor RaiA, partial [Azonexus sp.]